MNVSITRKPASLSYKDLFFLPAMGSAAAITETSSAAAQGLVELDFNGAFNGFPLRDIGAFLLRGLTVNGKGATPTSPGTAAKVRLNWYWSDTSIATIGDAPTLLAGAKGFGEITLPDSNSSATAGTRTWNFSAVLPVIGRYLYVGMNRDAFAANALIDFTARIVRIAE